MRSIRRVGVVAVLASVPVFVPALAENVTVGRFYTEIAHAKHIGADDAASAEAGLRTAGANLPKIALDNALTEGDMMLIATALGVSVTTHRPSQAVSDLQLSAFISQFGGQLRASNGNGSNPFRTNSDDQGRNGGGAEHHDHHDHGHDRDHDKSPCRP